MKKTALILFIFLLIIYLLPEKTLLNLKKTLSSLKISEIFIKGFYSFINFFKHLTGIDLLALFSNVFHSLKFNLEREIFKLK